MNAGSFHQHFSKRAEVDYEIIRCYLVVNLSKRVAHMSSLSGTCNRETHPLNMILLRADKSPTSYDKWPTSELHVTTSAFEQACKFSLRTVERLL
jgi:hypothetical protein